MKPLSVFKVGLAVLIATPFCALKVHANQNSWLLSSGIVFPSLNSAITENAGAFPSMPAQAFEAGYEFYSSSIAANPGLSTSYASGGAGWGGGIGAVVSDFGGQNTTRLEAGVGVSLGRAGLGLMAAMPVSPSTGSISTALGLLFPGGSSGVSFGVTAPTSLDSVTPGIGVSIPGFYSLEGDVTIPISTSYTVYTVGLGVTVYASRVGLGFKTSTPVGSGGVGSTSISGSGALRLSSDLSLIVKIPSSGDYLLALNWAF